MASPSNASEPESPEEEEYIDAGFDPILFWDQYRQIILLAGGAILLAAVAFGIYEYKQNQRITAAGTALAQAVTEDDYRAVINQYAGTVAAGDASLFLGSKLRNDGKYDDAVQVLQDFLDKYPNHPMAAGGDLSIAGTLLAEGKTDDAIARYQEVAAKYPDSYAAPIAVLAQANILRAQNKGEEARRLYENFVASFPDSIFSQEAMYEMHMLRPEPGSNPAAGQNPENPTNLLNVAPAPATTPAATPAATGGVAPGTGPLMPKPVLPASPAASAH